jgi:imidazolonepropionase-like amidohydrolase
VWIQKEDLVSTPASPWYIVRASRLLDGTGGSPVANPAVAVRDGRVHGVYADRVPEGVLPRDAQTIDLPGHTILPGLIDAHVHLVLPGDGTPFETTVREPDGVLLAIALRNAQAALAAGITTLRDCGGMRETTFQLRRAQSLGYAEIPRLHLCGQPLTITGGHCWYFGGEADGPDALRSKVRALVKAGADYIKIMATGGGTIGTISWRPSYSAEELRTAVEEAHRFGRRVAIHSLCAEATRNVLAAGADQIEHANFLVDETGRQEFDPRVADEIARTATPVTTTLAVGHYVIQTLSVMERRTPEEQVMLDRWRRMLEQNLDNVRRLRRAGVRLIAGTDAGWRFTPFDGLVTEMELLCEAGAGTAEAIVAATSGAAGAAGLGNTRGTIREGMAGDLIAVPGDPLADLDVLRRPALVMLAGAVVAQRTVPT